MRNDGTLGESKAATWTGKYILGGWAIQDDWVSSDAEGNVTRGMNIRSFNRETGKWDNRWLAAGSLEWQYFEAEKSGNRMVMTGDERRDAGGRAFIARNTFHDITAKSWNWRQDRSFDGGKTWVEGVAVIEARLEEHGPAVARSPAAEIEVAVGDMTFDALAMGPIDGELVLLLHGFPQTSYSWRHQMPSLAAAGYRAVAPNQRGYSPRARPEAVDAYGIARLAEDVIGMADALGAESFHLVGHDWGGAVAWLVATRYPERLRTLSVLSTPHFQAFGAALADPDSSQNEKSAYFARFAEKGAEHDFIDDNAAGLREVFAGAGLAQSDIDQYVRVLGEPAAMRAALRWYAAMTLPGSSGGRSKTGSQASATAPRRVPPIRVPTLYVWGSEDSAFSRDAAEATTDYVTGPYRFEILEGVGHWVPETAVETVNSLLLEHLRQP